MNGKDEQIAHKMDQINKIVGQKFKFKRFKQNFGQAYGALIHKDSFQIVEIEVSLTSGLPQITILGVETSFAKIIKEKIKSLLYICRVKMKSKRTVISFFPEKIKGELQLLELPVIVALLRAYGVISSERYEKAVFLGQMTLSGRLRPQKNLLPLVMKIRDKGYHMFLPEQNHLPPDVIKRDVTLVSDLHQVLNIFKKTDASVATVTQQTQDNTGFYDQNSATIVQNEDFWHCHERDLVMLSKPEFLQPLITAIAGNHSLCLINQNFESYHHVFETLKALLTPLPTQLSIKRVKKFNNNKLSYRRPLQVIDQHDSKADIFGDKRKNSWGKFGLIDYGYLVIKDFSQIKTRNRNLILDKLRKFDSNQTNNQFFNLLLLTRACACGQVRKGQCQCTYDQVAKFRQKFPEFLMQSLDIFTFIPSKKVSVLSLHSKERQANSQQKIKQLRLTLLNAKKRQIKRYQSYLGNGQVDWVDFERGFLLSDNAQAMIKNMENDPDYTNHKIRKILRVSRTIADLKDCKEVKKKHFMQAYGFTSNKLIST